MRILIWSAAVCAVFALAIVAAPGLAKPSTFAILQAASPSAATPGAATPIASGATIAAFTTTDGAWEIRVTAIEPRATLANFIAEGIYIVVSMEVTNTSSLPDTFPYGALTVTDDAGTVYIWVQDVSERHQTRNLNVFNTRSIPPGETVVTALAFAVPAEATGLEVTGPGWPASIPVER